MKLDIDALCCFEIKAREMRSEEVFDDDTKSVRDITGKNALNRLSALFGALCRVTEACVVEYKDGTRIIELTSSIPTGYGDSVDIHSTFEIGGAS